MVFCSDITVYAMSRFDYKFNDYGNGSVVLWAKKRHPLSLLFVLDSVKRGLFSVAVVAITSEATTMELVYFTTNLILEKNHVVSLFSPVFSDKSSDFSD